MKLTILAFASASDILGTRELDLELPADSSVADLKGRIEDHDPAIAPLWEGLAVAVNGELVGDETILHEGDEVALLPPVSGGSPEPPVLVEEPLDVSAIAARVADPGCGAVVLFVGSVRDQHGGRKVKHITYSAYRPMATARIHEIRRQLGERFRGARIAIVHRLGELPVGESSVVIAVASPHRAEAYEASRAALERLKAEVPIWKREHYADGETRWREEESLVEVAGRRS